MLEVKIDLKVPSQREYKKMHWGMREAKKFQMVNAIKETMILMDQKERYKSVLLVVGGTIAPEHCYISPIIGALRTTGWLDLDCVVAVRTSRETDGLMICL